MKNVSLFSKVILLGVLLFSLQTFAQRPKFSGSLKYIESLIAEKNLREGVPYSKTVLKRVKNALGENSPQYVQSFVNEIYFRTLVGYQKEVNKDLETLPARVTRVLGDTGRVAFNVVLRGVDSYTEVGNFYGAKKLLELSDKILASSKFNLSDNELIRFQYKKANNLNQRGFYDLARGISDSLIGVQYNRFTKKEVTKDLNGKISEKSLTAKEKRKRKYQYSDLLILNAKTYLDQGSYRQCYAKVREYNTWISENLGKKNLYFALITNMEGALNDAYGDYGTAPKYYNKSLKKYDTWDETNILTSLSNSISYAKDRKPLPSASQIKQAEDKINAKYGPHSAFMLEKELAAYSNLMNIVPNRLNERKLHFMQKGKYSVSKNDPTQIKLLENYVDIYKRFNRISDAEDSLKRALELKKELYGEDSPEYHASRIHLAEFYFIYSNDFPTIENIYKTSFFDIVAKNRSHSHKDFVTQLTDVAKFYELTDKFDLALKYAKEAAETEKLNSGEFSTKYATAQGYLARILTKFGNVQEAQDILGSATQIMKKAKAKTDEDKVHFAETYESIANVYNILGLYPEAQACLKEAAKLSKRVRNNAIAINSTEELADFYIKTGLYENAVDLLTETVRQKEKSSKNFKREIIGPLNQLGEVYLIKGEYGLAEKNIRKAMSISSEVFGDSSVRYIQSLKNLVKLYSSLGDYGNAIENSSKALELSKLRFGKKHIEVAKELNSYALIKYNSKQDVAEVESLLKESLEIIKFNLTDNNPLYAEGLKTLAYVYLKTNRLDESEQLLKTANEIWIQKLGASNINSAKVSLLLGDIYKSRKDYPKAESMYLNAQKIFGKIFNEKHPDYLITQSKLGQLNIAKGDYETAIKYFDKTTLVYLEFIKKYFPSLSFREKSKFWDSFKEEFELFSLTAFKLRDKNPKYLGKVFDNTMATKALLLSASIKVREHIMRSGDAELIDEYTEWIAKKELLTKAVSMTNEQLFAANIDIQKVEKEIEQKERYLSEQSELFAQNNETRSYKWTEFSKKLSPNEFIVEIVRFRDYTNQFSDSTIYAALIIGQKTDKNPEFVIMKDGNLMENRYLRYYRNSIRYQNADDISSNIFWQPIKSKIPDNANVYVSYEGVYNQINLETMKNTDGSYSFDKNNIMLVSNSKDILISKSRSKNDTLRSSNNKVALFGNPMYYSKKSTETLASNQESQDRSFTFIAGNVQDTMNVDSSFSASQVAKNQVEKDAKKDRIKQLPGAEYEVNDINGILSRKNWKSEVFVFAEADEERIKDIVNPQVFHIATHGFFMEDAQGGSNSADELSDTKITRNPLIRSGLLLKEGGDILEKNDLLSINNQNGVLTAYEAMNLNFDNTELVVLSACETGLGKVQIGEGVFGLQRAFLVAGANAVIMSLFKVNDKVTQELMEIFYQKWIDGMNKRMAFRFAKNEIKSKYPQPIFWGSFIMVGGD